MFRNLIQKALLLFCLITVNKVVASQHLKSNTYNKNSIKVSYSISDTADFNGQKAILIKDTSSSIVTNSNLNACQKTMLNFHRHKHFVGAKESQLVQKLSDSTWLVYYYFDNPWPLKNSDCVFVMTCSKSKNSKALSFRIKAEPDGLPKSKISRTKLYSVEYLFERIPGNNIQLVVTAKSSPAVFIPKWLVKASFPQVPVKSVRKLVKAISEISNN
jgi:hypothetical protein